MEDVISSISLIELSEIENLSIRSQNVCECNNLNDINSVSIPKIETV